MRGAEFRAGPSTRLGVNKSARLAEAKKMAKDAITGYIESLRKHGEPIPTDNETLVASLASC
jgi:hypothetical protein